MELSRLFADLHPRLVPFPIVLLLTGLLLDGLGWLRRSDAASWAGKVLTIAGTFALLAAFVCGICAEIWAGRNGVPHQQIKWHELAATAAAWGFIGLCAWRIFLGEGRTTARFLYVVCGLSLYALLATAGYLGGKLVTDYGASVDGARALSALSLHDLNTLAQRQTDRNLEYSDLMHHAAGLFVLALGLAILVRELWPQHASKVRWVAPSLFVVGGVLLFFTADLDLYALNDPRQWYDREVQAHKLLSILLVAFGAYALWRTYRRPAAVAEAGEPGASARSGTSGKSGTSGRSSMATTRFQNRMVAVFALIGGGVLFTHVHTVAPYANVAAGVYINHVVMGVVALMIGGVMLAQDAAAGRSATAASATPATAPVRSVGRPRRALALAFPLLLLVQAFLLVTYTEGLPWFIGYGHYDRWGPNGGTVAPYGDVRAELAFDADTGQMDLRVLDRFEDTPVRVPAERLDAVVSVGYQETSIPLAAVDGDGTGASHFRGDAQFLRHSRYFDAFVDLPLEGGMRRGSFDPWVVPAITGIPPNEMAAFHCPMHEGVRSNDEESDCPLCGMSLVPILNTVRTTLHDDGYAMDLVVTPSPAQPGQQVELRFVPKRSATGETIRNLQIVHEYPLHLILVGGDLVFFDHIHPLPEEDGSLTIDYTFPKPGTYLLFADIAPIGDRSQVFRLPVVVGGAAPSAPVTLVPEPAASREIGRYHVELFTQPRQLVAERECHIGFRLSIDGRPVVDLEPYIGAMGHCVIISEDTQTYLHSHPEQLTAAPRWDERAGPDIAFHTVFPFPGRYKVWGQFKRGEEIIIADFVLTVKKPIVPKWMSDFLIFD